MTKKVAATILTLMVLAFATTAMADTSVGTVPSRNSNTIFAVSPQGVESMPYFEPDDEVNFTIAGISDGDPVTLITYKYGEEPDNSTVQYIDQYKAKGSTLDVNYVIRDLAAGVYQMKIKAGENELYQGYYKVGDDVVSEQYIGDVNSDGEVTAKDNTILARYLARWAGYDDSTVDVKLADTNDDGEVTAKDNTILARHIAHWAGYEELPVK